MTCESDTPTLAAADMTFLEGMAADVVAASRVQPGEKVGDFGPNATGGTVIRPGGRDCYPAFWVRDYAMSLASGLITSDEQVHALMLTARMQQEGDWRTPSGSVVPHGAIVDHVSLDGKPIFFPGTIDDYENQGGVWGHQPPFGDHFLFTHMAWHCVRALNDPGILRRAVNGRTLIDRLDLAFGVAPWRADSHLVWCDEDNRGVAFGFMDSIVHTGDLLFPSVLKHRAAVQLSELHRMLGNADRAQAYDDAAACIKQAIPETFADGSGLLRASTGKSRQPDVWGSALAVYVGAVDAGPAAGISAALAEAYTAGTLACRGGIRHVLTCHDFSDASAWDTTLPGARKNRYQNGAYWNTPTGWACYAIARTDPSAAARLAREYIAELREGDFRRGDDFGSPWECFHPTGDHRQNPVYMTSVTSTLAALRRRGRFNGRGDLDGPG